jgi:hypothetical protein
MLTALAVTTVSAQSVAPLPLLGSDALGRAMPLPKEVRPFRNDKYVGIFYFTWLKNIPVFDNTLILKNNPDAMQTNASPPWGHKHAYHFWGEPLFGYYRSDDPWIIRRHAALLSDAGVDFIVLDATNGVIYEDVVRVILEVFEQQRAAGEHVPQITFMVNSRAGRTASRIYETFYQSGQHAALWFQWQGKPLLICDPQEASTQVAEHFTLRKAHWPFNLVDTHNAWHWEATYPQVYSYDRDPSQPEQVNVSVGQNLHQETGKVEMMSTGQARGRSFHNGHVDERADAFQYGLNFQEQWEHALQLDPEVTFVTGWNEWIAMQLNTSESGPPIFCDQFDIEASRDVEMMKGGYADNYYMQLAANIRRFKGMQPVDRTEQKRTIRIEGPMSQWDDVAAVYRDHVNDTHPRDFPGCGTHHYQVTSGRNDFQIAKVTEDAEHFYFYMQTHEPISDAQDPNWMWLLLDLDTPNADHWEGFEVLVDRGSIQVCRGNWTWEAIGSAAMRTEGKQMHLAIPKSVLNSVGTTSTGATSAGATSTGASNRGFSFKWIDNAQSPGEIMDTYTHGDAAPGGRFRFRYSVAP